MSRRLALLAAWPRVVYATLFVTALGDLVTALRLVDGVRSLEGRRMAVRGRPAGCSMP